MSTVEHSSLERWYRRLLAAYPAAYRRRRGDEIVSTLLESAPAGRRRPDRHEVADLVGGGLRERFGLHTRPALAAGLRVAGPVALAVIAALTLSDAWFSLHPPLFVLDPFPTEPVIVTSLHPATAAVALAVAWSLAVVGTAFLPRYRVVPVLLAGLATLGFLVRYGQTPLATAVALFGAIAIADAVTGLGLPGRRPWWAGAALIAGTAATTTVLVAAPMTGWTWVSGALVAAGVVAAVARLATRRPVDWLWAILILLPPGVFLLGNDIRIESQHRFDPFLMPPVAVLLAAAGVAALWLATRHRPRGQRPTDPRSADQRLADRRSSGEAANRTLAGVAATALAVAAGMAAFGALTEAALAEGFRDGVLTPATPAYLLVVAAILTWGPAPRVSRALTAGAALAAASGVTAAAYVVSDLGGPVLPGDSMFGLPYLLSVLLLTTAAAVTHPGRTGGRPAGATILIGAGAMFGAALASAYAWGTLGVDAISLMNTYRTGAPVWVIIPLTVALIAAVPAAATVGARLGAAVSVAGIAVTGLLFFAGPTVPAWVFGATAGTTMAALLLVRLAAVRAAAGSPPDPAQVAATTG
jgi:hypothetical protein